MARLQSEHETLKSTHSQTLADLTAKTVENENSEAEISKLRETIQTIDSHKEKAEKELESVKIERIKEKTEMEEKFETDKEQLGKIAEDLEVKLNALRVELEESEGQSAERLSQIGQLEIQMEKSQSVAMELKLGFYTFVS